MSVRAALTADGPSREALKAAREALIAAGWRRPKRARMAVENKPFGDMVERQIAALSGRVAAGDVESLPRLVALAEVLDAATDAAVKGLRVEGYSWQDIADRLGVTKQSAHGRWGHTSSS